MVLRIEAKRKSVSEKQVGAMRESLPRLRSGQVFSGGGRMQNWYFSKVNFQSRSGQILQLAPHSAFVVRGSRLKADSRLSTH
jgi:hypothetical protein